MDFDKLSDKVLFNIFSRLNLKEVVKIGRVSKHFSAASKMVLSGITAFETNSETMPLEAFSNLLELCSESLESIRINNKSTNDHVVEFSKYSFPNLRCVKIFPAQIDSGVLADLIAKNQKLESLDYWIEYYEKPLELTFPKIRCTNLENVRFGFVNFSFIRSLTEYCPNLKFLQFSANNNVTAKDFDQIFKNCGKIERVIADFAVGKFLLDPDNDLIEFWKTESLRALWLGGIKFNDEVFVKISNHFSGLEELGLRSAVCNVSNRGIATLASLKNLRILSIWQRRFAVAGINEGVEYLAEFGSRNLRYISFSDPLSPSTVTSLIKNLPKLTVVKIFNINGVVSLSDAAKMLRMIGKYCSPKFSIVLDDYKAKKIWSSEKVEAVLRELELAGRDISINVMEVPLSSVPQKVPRKFTEYFPIEDDKIADILGIGALISIFSGFLCEMFLYYGLKG